MESGIESSDAEDVKNESLASALSVIVFNSSMESRSEVRLMLNASVEREADLRAVDGLVDSVRDVAEVEEGLRSSMRAWA